MISKLDRYKGCMLGLAVGDALGTTLEFKSPGTFSPITEMNGGGPFNLKAGEWTDDTSMALCLGQSLLDCQGFDAKDQMNKYLKWYKEGYFSSNGTCFDIGITVSNALNKFVETNNPLAGSTDTFSAGNGSLMRLAPIPLYFADNKEIAIKMSIESSKTTHAATACIDACKYFSSLIIDIINGVTKDELLSKKWNGESLCSDINEIANGSFKDKNPPEIIGSGYVVKSLEAVLWAFYNSTSFEEGLLMAVNLGDDADTTGAIYGQIAGVYYGLEGIPKNWLDKIVDRELIEKMSVELLG